LWKNVETLDAVLMRISQVGESASKTSAEALAEVPDVEWRDIKGSAPRSSTSTRRPTSSSSVAWSLASCPGSSPP